MSRSIASQSSSRRSTRRVARTAASTSSSCSACRPRHARRRAAAGRRRRSFTIAALKVDARSVRFVDQTLATPETTTITDDRPGGRARSRCRRERRPTFAPVAAKPTTPRPTCRAAPSSRGARRPARSRSRPRPARPRAAISRRRSRRSIDDGRVDVDARYRIDASGATPTGTIDAIAAARRAAADQPAEREDAVRGGRRDRARRRQLRPRDARVRRPTR